MTQTFRLILRKTKTAPHLVALFTISIGLLTLLVSIPEMTLQIAETLGTSYVLKVVIFEILKPALAATALGTAFSFFGSLEKE